MSPNGMQPASVLRLQGELRPYNFKTAGKTLFTQSAVEGWDSKPIATDGLMAEGRKKFVRAAGT
jgi:hypothetical protein